MSAQWPEFFLGQTVSVEGTFKDDTGALANPATVITTVTRPDGTTMTPGTGNVSVGVFRSKFVLTQVGWWGYKMTGTESDGDIDVVSSRIYCRKPY